MVALVFYKSQVDICVPFGHIQWIITGQPENFIWLYIVVFLCGISVWLIHFLEQKSSCMIIVLLWYQVIILFIGCYKLGISIFSHIFNNFYKNCIAQILHRIFPNHPWENTFPQQQNKLNDIMVRKFACISKYFL